MKVEVINRYADRYTKEIHEAGSIMEITEERYSDLRRFVKETLEEKTEETIEDVLDVEKLYPFPKHTGGGWYELTNGEKVKGKENAEDLESKLRS